MMNYGGPDDGDRGLMTLFLAVIFSILGMLCCGCKTKQVIVERVRTDTTYITKQQRDSIFLHDSIYLHEWTVADTVYMLQEKWHTKYVEKEVHDTIYRNSTDSIPVPYPVTKEVPRDYTWWDKTRFYALYIIISFLLLVYRKPIFGLLKKVISFL